MRLFFKDNSIGNILLLDLPFERLRSRKIRIKLEIDTNPPAGSTFLTSFITFPVTMPVTTQILESGFALKLHALLCRPFIKGRDWYDFIWYSARDVRPDLVLLQNALQQYGPWQSRRIQVNLPWLRDQMSQVIAGIDWIAARNDVQRFLPTSEQEGLFAWGTDLFKQQLERVCYKS
jgi:hypothetical protein